MTVWPWRPYISSAPADEFSSIGNLYIGDTTCLKINGRLGPTIKPSRGVRQGDPVSLFVFNAVIDWVVSSLPTYIGLPVDPHMVNYLSFADDLVICAQTQTVIASLFCALKDGLAVAGLLTLENVTIQGPTLD
jgi:hypothetical protein